MSLAKHHLPVCGDGNEHITTDSLLVFTLGGHWILGNSVYINPNYTATVEVLENGLSSNLSFPAEL